LSLAANESMNDPLLTLCLTC